MPWISTICIKNDCREEKENWTTNCLMWVGWLVRLAAARGGDPTVSTQAVLSGPFVRRGLWLPPINSRGRPRCSSAGASR
jgi:hypothetical protein